MKRCFILSFLLFFITLSHYALADTKISTSTPAAQNTQPPVEMTVQTEEPTSPSAVFWKLLLDPNVAYILLLLGIYGLFFEFYCPGFIVPGVIGAISLILALYAFNHLSVNYAGIALLFLGITFLIIEVFISSFGILGVGGIIAFATGSILLLDINSPGYQIAWSLVIIMTLFTTLFFILLISMAVRAMRKKIISGKEALINSTGKIIHFHHEKGTALINGETWNVISSTPLKSGDMIHVTELNDLTLTVQPIQPPQIR